MKRKKRNIFAFCVVMTTMMAMVLVIVICNIVVNRNAEHRTFSSADSIPYRNIAVLLGTGPNSRYSKGPNMFYWNRLHAISELYKKRKFNTLIISGTKRPGYDEPTIMKKDLVKEGIPDSIIFLDGKGYNTLLSIENAKRIYKQDSIIVVSQKWHNQRAIYIADHIGINAIGYNAPDVNTITAHITHLRELLARVKLIIYIPFEKKL